MYRLENGEVCPLTSRYLVITGRTPTRNEARTIREGTGRDEPQRTESDE